MTRIMTAVFILALTLISTAVLAGTTDPAGTKFGTYKGCSLESRGQVEIESCKLEIEAGPGSTRESQVPPGSHRTDLQPDLQLDRIQMFSF
jgi:hypothetical protein